MGGFRKCFRKIQGGVLFTGAILAVFCVLALQESEPVGCSAQDLLLQTILPAQGSLDTPVANEKVVYLTFDDGPSNVTVDVLDILQAERVSASFFVIASDGNADYFPLVERISQEGHCIALHSGTHDYQKIYASTDAFWDDLAQLQSALGEYAFATSNVMRFPGGSSNTVSQQYGGSHIMQDLKTQATEKGFFLVDWNVCADDSIGLSPSPSEIYNNIIQDVGDKTQCIVLMHDTKQNANTAAALPDVIAWFKNAGFRFDTVDNLPNNT